MHCGASEFMCRITICGLMFDVGVGVSGVTVGPRQVVMETLDLIPDAEGQTLGLRPESADRRSLRV